MADSPSLTIAKMKLPSTLLNMYAFYHSCHHLIHLLCARTITNISSVDFGSIEASQWSSLRKLYDNMVIDRHALSHSCCRVFYKSQLKITNSINWPSSLQTVSVNSIALRRR